MLVFGERDPGHELAGVSIFFVSLPYVEYNYGVAAAGEEVVGNRVVEMFIFVKTVTE